MTVFSIIMYGNLLFFGNMFIFLILFISFVLVKAKKVHSKVELFIYLWYVCIFCMQLCMYLFFCNNVWHLFRYVCMHYCFNGSICYNVHFYRFFLSWFYFIKCIK